MRLSPKLLRNLELLSAVFDSWERLRFSEGLIEYEGFEQGPKENSQRGHAYGFEKKVMILFYTIKMIRRITDFIVQYRWLNHQK